MAVTVGIRELRSNLRAYLDRVRGGEDLVVTDRGVPIAHVTPVGWEARLAELIREGIVTPPRRPKEPIDLESLPRMRSGSLSDIVLDERRRRDY